jgi:hypothetical protein
VFSLGSWRLSPRTSEALPRGILKKIIKLNSFSYSGLDPDMLQWLYKNAVHRYLVFDAGNPH